MSAPVIELVIQNDKKVLCIKDVTPPTIGGGWWRTTNPNGALWNIDEWFASNNANYPDRHIGLTVTIQTKTKTYTAQFDGSELGLTTPTNTKVLTPEDVNFNIGISGDNLVIVASNVTNFDVYTPLPDGIYTIVYGIANDTLQESYVLDSPYVLTNNADLIILKKTDEIQDKMFVCPNYDLEETLDFLVYRAMHETLSIAREVSSSETILNTLDHINNEDYDYYED